MKASRTILICCVVAVLVLGFASLPAAARDVSSGDKAFVYETGVRFTGDLAGVTELRMYNSNHNSVLTSYPVTNPNDFTFMESVFLEKTGTWYAWDGTQDLGYILVRYPELKIDVVLALDTSASVQQYGFVENTVYKVKITSPEVGSVQPSFASVDIVFQLDGGASSTYASGQSFANIPLTSSSFVTTQSFVPKDFSHGTWGIYARWNTPRSFYDFAEDSNVIIMNTGTPPTSTHTQTPVPTTTLPTEVPTVATTVPTPVPTTKLPTEIPTASPVPTQSPAPVMLLPLVFGMVALLLRKE